MIYGSVEYSNDHTQVKYSTRYTRYPKSMSVANSGNHCQMWKIREKWTEKKSPKHSTIRKFYCIPSVDDNLAYLFKNEIEMK